MDANIAKPSFKEILILGDHLQAKQALYAMGANLPPMELVERVIIPVLEAIGGEWEAGDLALSQVYVAGRICERLVNELLPPAHPQRKKQPRLAIGVLEDYHALGKNLVVASLRSVGYEVADYGHGLKVPDLTQRVVSDGVEILLVSCLMLASAFKVGELRRALDAIVCRTRLVVGGAPFRLDTGLWKHVRADACGATASDAIAIVASMEDVLP